LARFFRNLGLPGFNPALEPIPPVHRSDPEDLPSEIKPGEDGEKQ
jgi:hypothetical protein